MDRRRFLGLSLAATGAWTSHLLPVHACQEPRWRPDGAASVARIGVLTPDFDPVPESEMSAIAPDGSRIDALDAIQTAAVPTEVGRDRNPAPLALAAKAIIDREYGAPLEINRIAKRLHVSPAVLSRTFRRTYGMPPVRYRHHVRVMDALMQFAEGAAPVQVFQDAGFEDLSRFYKIFRKVTCAPPGSYRPVMSRNAKT